MYKTLLASVGLTEEEAQLYELLLQYGPQGVGELLKRVTGIKRGLLYKVLERLEKRRLVVTQKKAGVSVFVPESPDVLLRCLQEQEDELKRSKGELESVLPELKAKYNLSTERPALRFFEGVEGLRAMYEDRLAAGAKELYFIRSSRHGVHREVFGKWFDHYRQRQTAIFSHVYALTVDDADTNHDSELDKARHMLRTWLRPEDYTSPVEIDVYANKVTVISFGKEIFGIMLESEVIAKAMKDLFILAERGAKTIPVTHDHGEPKRR